MFSINGTPVIVLSTCVENCHNTSNEVMYYELNDLLFVYSIRVFGNLYFLFFTEPNKHLLTDVGCWSVSQFSFQFHCWAPHQHFSLLIQLSLCSSIRTFQNIPQRQPNGAETTTWNVSLFIFTKDWDSQITNKFAQDTQYINVRTSEKWKSTQITTILNNSVEIRTVYRLILYFRRRLQLKMTQQRFVSSGTCVKYQYVFNAFT